MIDRTDLFTPGSIQPHTASAVLHWVAAFFAGWILTGSGGLPRASARHLPAPRPACIVAATQPSTQPTDPQWVVTGGDNKHVIEWDVAGNAPKELYRYKDHGDKVSYISVSLGTGRLFTASYDHEVRIYALGQPGTGPIGTFKDHEPKTQVWVVVPSNDGTRALSATNSGEIIYWNATSSVADDKRTIAATGPSHDPVGGLAFLPDDQHFLACTGYGQMILYDIDATNHSLNVDGQPFSTGNIFPINSVAITKNGKTAVTGGFDMTVRVWDVSMRKEKCRITTHQDIVWRVAISPDEKMFASASEDGTVRLFNLTTGAPCTDGNQQPAFTGPGPDHGIMGLAFVSNSKIVYTSSEYDPNNPVEVKSWDISAFHP